MTTSSGIVSTGGHQYLMTWVDGNMTNQIGCDPEPTPLPPVIQSKAKLLIATLVAGSATQLQRDMALGALLALQLGLVDL